VASHDLGRIARDVGHKISYGRLPTIWIASIGAIIIIQVDKEHNIKRYKTFITR